MYHLQSFKKRFKLSVQTLTMCLRLAVACTFTAFRIKKTSKMQQSHKNILQFFYSNICFYGLNSHVSVLALERVSGTARTAGVSSFRLDRWDPRLILDKPVWRTKNLWSVCGRTASRPHGAAAALTRPAGSSGVLALVAAARRAMSAALQPVHYVLQMSAMAAALTPHEQSLHHMVAHCTYTGTLVAPRVEMQGTNMMLTR